MNTPTPRQLAILRAITEAVESRGYPPTLREIGDLVGLASVSSVVHQLKHLERMGLIRRDAATPRSIEVTDPRLRLAKAVSILESLQGDEAVGGRSSAALVALQAGTV